MATPERLQQLAQQHGTPLFVVDHDVLRENYRRFTQHLPRVQAYYAVKANSDPAIVETLFRSGASFDVASIAEFRTVYENIKSMPDKERQDYIWDKIVYANPIKDNQTLIDLDPYKPLVTYDNFTEIGKVKRFAPNAGLMLRIRVPNVGAVVELSSKFGAASEDALPLIEAAFEAGLGVEGLSFHVGSQCNDPDSYIRALDMVAPIFQAAWNRGYARVNILDIGGGFPAPYDDNVRSFPDLAEIVNAQLNRLFPSDMQILAEPGRFLIATAGTAVAKVIGKTVRDGKPCYYINDGVYHTFSGVIFDHIQYHLKAFKSGETRTSAVFGPTCDALDTISLTEDLPELELEDLVYSENIGAYSHASSTHFNGFPPATVVHINRSH